MKNKKVLILIGLAIVIIVVLLIIFVISNKAMHIPDNDNSNKIVQSSEKQPNVVLDITGASSVENLLDEFIKGYVEKWNFNTFRNLSEFMILDYEDDVVGGLESYYSNGLSIRQEIFQECLPLDSRFKIFQYFSNENNQESVDQSILNYSYKIVANDENSNIELEKQDMKKLEKLEKYYPGLSIETIITEYPVEIIVDNGEKSLVLKYNFGLVKANGNWYIYHLELEEQ